MFGHFRVFWTSLDCTLDWIRDARCGCGHFLWNHVWQRIYFGAPSITCSKILLLRLQRVHVVHAQHEFCHTFEFSHNPRNQGQKGGRSSNPNLAWIPHRPLQAIPSGCRSKASVFHLVGIFVFDALEHHTWSFQLSSVLTSSCLPCLKQSTAFCHDCSIFHGVGASWNWFGNRCRTCCC